ncbi:DUF268 domain-containing protein [Candidatus Gracilibacteria bacterium]|nr:DUF268 domain-containing protein [Candidatus Gracilibacteria bacterium]
MYNFLRSIKRIVYQVISWMKFPLILSSYIKYISKDKKGRFLIPFSSVMPCLFENIPYTRFDTHYVYHTAWAARKVKEINAEEHIDISSSLYFSSIVSAFKPVSFYDFRPAKLNLSNLVSESANLLHLPFADNSISSLSCMHTVEHVGLGRYGDKIDPDGDLHAVKELSRVVKQDGNLLFVVPVGKPRIQFNAHRIYSYKMVIEMFPGFEVKEFSLIPDNALEKGIIYNATETESDMQSYGCGCFWLTKK